MTPMRSPMVMASTWSCVTKIMVVCNHFCRLTSSERSVRRNAASRAASGLVEQEAGGLAHDRLGGRHALAFAAGKLAGEFAEQPNHIHGRGGRIDAAFDLGLGQGRSASGS